MPEPGGVVRKIPARQIRPEVDLRTQDGSRMARGYYEWGKWVLRTGDRRITRAAMGGLLVATFGTWGHFCHPTRPKLEAESGLSSSDLGRCFDALTGTGWLRRYPRPGTSTIFCIAQLDGRRLREPGQGGPCPMCWPSLATQPAGDGGNETRPTGGLAVSSPVGSNQGSLSREPAADGTLDESVISQTAWDLYELLWQHSPEPADPDQLVAFARTIDSFLDRRSPEELRAAIQRFDLKAHKVVPAVLASFIENQKPVAPVRARRRTKAEEKEARMLAEAAAAEALMEQREEFRRLHGREMPRDPWDY